MYLSCAVSSVGRATRLHREGRRFESYTAHSVKSKQTALLAGAVRGGAMFFQQKKQASQGRENSERRRGIIPDHRDFALVVQWIEQSSSKALM